MVVKSDSGDFDEFSHFMRRRLAVPHSEIKAKLDAEKAAKKWKHRGALDAKIRVSASNQPRPVRSGFSV
jgi:hypothetical protein